MSWLGAVAAGVALASTDVSAPTFVGATDADTVVLDRAWQAAASCAGWVAPHTDTVEVTYGPDPLGWAGHAHMDSRGLYRIDLHIPSPRTMVHEVAHAWVSFRGWGTPKALSEGLTDLLTACAFRDHPELGEPRDRVSLAELAPPSLTFWRNPDEADKDARIAGYAAAYELALAAAEVTGERALWPGPNTRRTDWSWFWSLLSTVRPYGAGHDAVLAAMGPAIETEDLDGDGLSVTDERTKGLDPLDWDSDDDGFSDGIGRLPKGAIALPLDESPVCSGWQAASDGARFSFETAGPDASSVVAEARTLNRLLGEAADGIELRGGEVIYLTARLGEPLFAHAQVWAVAKPGRGLEPDPTCPIPGRRVDPSALPDLYAPVVYRRTAPNDDDIRQMMSAATRHVDACTDRRPGASGLERGTVQDESSATAAVAASCFPDLTTAFQQAQAQTLSRCLQSHLGIEPGAVPASPTVGLLGDVANLPPPDGSTVEVLSMWLDLVAARLGIRAVVDAQSWDDLVASVRRYADDRILRALLEEASVVGRGVVRPPVASEVDATELRSEPVWQCSGWRSAGNPPFDASPPSPRLLSLEAWDSEARVVRGTGTGALIWRAGGVRSAAGCGESGGLVWYTPSGKTPPAALLAAFEARSGLGNELDPLVVRLGGTSTGTENGGVLVSDRTMTWATSTGNLDVLALLVEVIGQAAELGASVDWSLVNSEIQVWFGARRPPDFPLETP